VSEVLIDTDILSFYFRGDIGLRNKFDQYLKEFDQINISIITYYEILAGLKFKEAAKQLQQFEEFSTSNSIIHLTEESAQISAEIYSDLRKSGVTIGTSDLLIAGIALENDLILITNNEKHYSPIRNLRVENWLR
jgi:tRNA(fMet)-specific endonuclease VapC